MSLNIKFHDQQFSVGDSLKLNYKIREKDKDRIQAFDGILISISGNGSSKSITIQKAAADGIKVERIFPINSPWIDSIKKLRSPQKRVRRSKLYHLRNSRSRKTV